MIWHGATAALTCVCLNLTAFNALAGSAQKSLVVQDSFSARYEYRHQPSGIMLDAAMLLVSPHGIRVDQRMNSASHTLIGNFKEHRFWFLDRQRKISHEIPISLHVPLTGIEHPDNIESFAGFIQFKPCQGVDARSAGLSVWRGKKMQMWHCENAGELLETQWYDARFGVVVKSLTPDGFASELTEFRARTVTDEHFHPPASYRAVSISELMGVAIPIKPYELSKQSQN